VPPIIRFAEETDAPQIQAIYAPFCEGTAVSFEMVAPSVEEMAGRIRKITAQFPWLVAEEDERLLGYVYACPHRERAAYQWSTDVSAYVRPECHRRGMGRALYTALFGILVQQGYFKAFAGITLPNPASVGLHRAMGFEPVGMYRGVGCKFGVWHDTLWLQRELQAEIPEPSPPKSVHEVRDTPPARQALADGLALLRRPSPT
jgi:L-amino acid N-acyltransferase YncA